MPQWLRLHAPKAGGLGSIPGQGNRSHILQLRPCAAKINKNKYFLKNLGFTEKVRASENLKISLTYNCSGTHYISLNCMTWSDIGFPGGSDGKESACNARDPGSIPESGRSTGEGNGYPLQYSCLENSMDRGAWQVTVLRVTKSWIQLSY